MQIDYAGKITKDEYFQAMQVILGRYRKTFRWIIGFDLLLIIFILVPRLIDHESLINQLQYMIGFIVLLGLVLYLYFFQPHLAARKMDHPSNPYKDPVSGYLSEDELVVRFSDAKSSFLWKGFTNYVHKQDVLLLYRTNASVVILSKTMFASPEDWENCIVLVKTKLDYLKKLQPQYRISL